MTKNGDIVFAPGISVVVLWAPSQGIEKLYRGLEVLLCDEIPKEYVNTTILHQNEGDSLDHLDGLTRAASKHNAAVVFSRQAPTVSPLKMALRAAPSEKILRVDLDKPVDDTIVIRAWRALDTLEHRVFIDGHPAFHQSQVDMERGRSVCSVIPVSLPKLASRVDVCSKSIQLQETDGVKPDVIVAYSFSKLSGDEVELMKICHQRGLTMLFHRHQHDVFPPALTRNVGARRVVGRPVVFIDADMYLHPETFWEAIRTLEERPCVVYVEPAMMHYIDETDWIFRKMTKALFEEKSKKVGSAPGTGAVVFVTQEVLQATHGYDERFVGYGYTDWDFMARLPAAGFKVVSLTRSTGIRAMHLPHGARHGTNPPSKKNEEIYNKENGRNPRRNPDSWGGIPVCEYEKKE